MQNEGVRGERTGDLIARRISRAIVGGELRPGTRLTEESLATSYRVSRTPIREALIQLSAGGLVQLVPNRGATVLDLTLEDVAQVYHLRAVLEGEAVRLAAKTAPPELLARLESACDRIGLVHDASPSEQLAVDTDFHHDIIEAAGNRRLAALIRQISAIPEAFRSTYAYPSEDMSEAESQHRAILAELARKRPRAAERLARQHVAWACDRALVRLKEHLPP